MIPFQTTPRIVANQLRNRILKSPAGGTFHDAVVSEARELHKGAANETAFFSLITADGRSYEISVERRA